MKFSFLCSKCLLSSRAGIVDDSNLPGVQFLQNVHAFSYEELKVATNEFNPSNKIGEGGFGTVYKGRLNDGRDVAVKVLSVESRQGDREFMSELSSVSNIRHENLVQLHGGCIEGRRRILVYEYMEHNSLARILLGDDKLRSKLNWRVRKEICIGIARGLFHIHEEVKPHIVHRDIKASNILMEKNFNPRISDFGLSKLFPEHVSHITTRVAGTLGYLAPEYAVSGHLTRKSDVYSYGVLILQIVSGRSAVDFDIELGEHYLVQKAWEMHKDNRLVDIIDSTLEHDGNFSEEEAIHFLKVGLLCVQEKCNLRPKMSAAIEMMMIDQNDQIKVNAFNNVEIPQPGVINNNDLKIAPRKSESSSKSSTSSMQSSQVYRFNSRV
ncbi:PREDICTED: putative serine/threonine-protein kinase [Fragaria vesca subsp. vesca]|uniref:putative serine/threonine-protein kinase n=1 Tax=Fragaria vesca subsp. vesca TaxID=101020 RepID=UPI0002C35028|nr:PREDICTED: putative serine/threonine-protein kinase [Fragaria vesca subsp. vesca]